MLLFCQVSPLSRKNSHPFEIEFYIKKKRYVIEEQRWLDKDDSKRRRNILGKTRVNPFKPGAQQY